MRFFYLLFFFLISTNALVSKDHEPLPEKRFIIQVKAGQGSLPLSDNEIKNLNSRLTHSNNSSTIKTYILIIDHIPIDFGNTQPHYRDITDILSNRRVKDPNSVTAQLISQVNLKTQAVLRENSAKIEKSINSPAVFCWVIRYNVYYKKSNWKSFTTYYAVKSSNSTEPFADQYKSILNQRINTNFNSRKSDDNYDQLHGKSFYSKISLLIQQVENVNNNFNTGAAFIDALSRITDVRELVDKLEDVDASFYQLLTFEQRIKFLKLLSSEKLLGETQEKCCLHLLATTPDKDINKLLTALEGKNELANGTSLLSCLVKRIDDSHLFFGDDNYLKLIQILSRQTVQSSYYRNKGYEHDDLTNRLIVWDKHYHSYPPIGTNTYTVSLTGHGNIEFTSRTVTDYSLNEDKEDWRTYLPVWTSNSPVTLAPFQPVIFINRSDLSLLASSASPNEAVIVPAIVLKYAADKQWNNDVGKGISMAFDIATIAVPFTKVYKAGSIITRIYRGLDIAAAAGAAANLSLELLDDDSRFRAAVDKYNMVVAVLSIPSILSGTGKLQASMATEYVKEVKAVEEPLTILAKSNNAAAEKMLQLSDELEEQLRIQRILVDAAGEGRLLAVKLKKLVNQTSSIPIPWKNLDNMPLYVEAASNAKPQSAKTFAAEVANNNLFDIVFDNGTYAKIDVHDGRFLLGNVSGEFLAFGVIDGAIALGPFKASVFNVSEEIFRSRLAVFINEQASKLKGVCGINPIKQVTVNGKVIQLSADKANTFVGRYRPDLESIFKELGSFKNISLGQMPGGVNLLNRTDFYTQGNWWVQYNRPWLDAALQRGDPITVVTNITRENLLRGENGVSFYAYELAYLVNKGIKPVNLTPTEWEAAKKVINDFIKEQNLMPLVTQ